jgi:uncharacterized protein (DUF927 family)
MEYPETNSCAQCYAVFSFIIVLISTVTFVVSTFEESSKRKSTIFSTLSHHLIDPNLMSTL